MHKHIIQSLYLAIGPSVCLSALGATCPEARAEVAAWHCQEDAYNGISFDRPRDYAEPVRSRSFVWQADPVICFDTPTDAFSEGITDIERVIEDIDRDYLIVPLFESGQIGNIYYAYSDCRYWLPLMERSGEIGHIDFSLRGNWDAYDDLTVAVHDQLDRRRAAKEALLRQDALAVRLGDKLKEALTCA